MCVGGVAGRGAVGKKCTVISKKYNYETRFIEDSLGVLVGTGTDSQNVVIFNGQNLITSVAVTIS